MKLQKAIGLLIVICSLYLAHLLQLRAYHFEHIRFVNCVQSGEKPVICSFQSVFNPEKYN